MKKAFLIALFAYAGFSSYGQKIRFTDSTNVWTWYEYGCGGDPHVFQNNGRYIGDTIVSGLTYKKLYTFTPGYIALIREDTLMRKVFTLDTTEKVLYDYNLHVGDTFRSTYTAHIVDSVDSVVINGLWHKYWHLIDTAHGCCFVAYYFIEGIGCTNGPLYPLYPYFFENCVQLTCFNNHGINPSLSHRVDYYFDNTTSCSLTFGLKVNNIVNKNIDIFPNPIDNTSKIVFPYNISSGSVVVVNGMGQVVVNIPIHNKEEIIISDKIKVPGIYYYRVTDEHSGRVFSGKFLKQ